MRVADVHRPGEVGRRVHQPHHGVDEVVDVAERARLLAVAVDGDRLAAQRLDDEVADHAAVVRVHARAVGVEDAHHLDAEAVLAVVVEEQRLRAALALVVAGAHADRVDVAPVVLGLRVDLRVAVDLAGGGLQDPRLHPLGQAQHVDRAVHAGLGRLHRVVLVVDRAGRAGQVVDLVDLDVEREGHVVAHQLEHRVAQQVRDVALAAGEVVVDAEHVVALGQQPLAQVRPEEAGAAGDQDLAHGPCRTARVQAQVTARPARGSRSVAAVDVRACRPVSAVRRAPRTPATRPAGQHDLLNSSRSSTISELNRSARPGGSWTMTWTPERLEPLTPSAGESGCRRCGFMISRCMPTVAGRRRRTSAAM